MCLPKALAAEPFIEYFLLTLIQEEMNENSNRFLQSTAFMNMLIPLPNEATK